MVRGFEGLISGGDLYQGDFITGELIIGGEGGGVTCAMRGAYNRGLISGEGGWGAYNRDKKCVLKCVNRKLL